MNGFVEDDYNNARQGTLTTKQVENKQTVETRECISTSSSDEDAGRGDVESQNMNDILSPKQISTEGERLDDIVIASPVNDDADADHEPSGGKFDILYVFREWYAPFLMDKRTKVAVLVLFGAFFGTMAYFSSKLEVGFDVADLTPFDSYYRDYLSVTSDLELLSTENTQPFDVFLYEYDYEKAEVQREILRLQEEISLKSYNREEVGSWLSSFIAWSSEALPGKVQDGIYADEATFYQSLSKFLASYDLFAERVVMDSNGRIQASRIQCAHFRVLTADETVEAMEGTRDILRHSWLDPAPSSFSYQ